MSTVAPPVVPPETSFPRMDAGSLIQALASHRKQRPRDRNFWDIYCRLLRILCRSTAVVVITPQAGAWQILGAECGDGWLEKVWSTHLPELQERVRHNGFAYCPVMDAGRQARIVTVIRSNGLDGAFILLDVPERERAHLNELIMRALLAADFPETEARPSPVERLPVQDVSPGAAVTTAAPDETLYALLEVAAQVMTQARVDAAAMTLVNGVATQFKAYQVALGWIDDGKVRLAAVSHLDRFEHNSENARLLEQAFTACLGRPETTWYVQGQDADELLAEGLEDAHARLHASAGFGAQCLLPVLDANGVVRSILFLGFAEPESRPAGLEALQATMGFMQPWLQTHREHDRGLWWHLVANGRRLMERFTGPDFAWGRAWAVLASMLLLFVVFGTWDYHVEATSQLTTDSSRIVSAQFDSRVENVNASAGDFVRKGTLLATLDTREMRQQELDIRAERQRLTAETDKARAAGNLAEMEIAHARLAQSDARLARLVHYLSQARAVAPFDGVVVEGERKELLNAPVKKGDKLFKLARIDGLYVEMLVPEREIRYVKPDAKGVLRLVSRPDLEFPFKLATIIPMAQVKGQEGNHFLIKAQLTQEPEAWWRPGMSGMARIEAGQQNILWIWTHRVTDTLRMKLWWLGW